MSYKQRSALIQNFMAEYYKQLKNKCVRVMPLLVMSAITFYSSGQGSIKGRVTDQYQGLPAALVFLLDPDSITVNTVATDTSGAYLIENILPGKYRVSVRMMGFTTYYSNLLIVGRQEIVLPVIVLREDVAFLKEVEVTGERDLVQQQSDRVVIQVGTSITASGNSVLEVLQKSPGVIVNRQDNSILFNGRNGVTIMINGKQLQMSSEALIQMMEGMSASNIEKIELITTPDSKYDAAGGGGIIHLITKEDGGMGTTGSLSLTAGASWAETFAGSFNIHHRKKNVVWFADYTITRRRNLHIARLRMQITGATASTEITSYSHRPNLTTQQNFRSGFEYNLNSKTSLNFDITAFRRHWYMDADTDEARLQSPGVASHSAMDATETNRWQSATTSFSVIRAISEASNLTVSLDYLYYDNHNPSHYKTETSEEQSASVETSEIDVTKETPIHFAVARVDYHRTVKENFSWDSGVKSVYTILNNEVVVQRWYDEHWTTDVMFSSSSSLSEQIGAAYFSWKWKASEGLDVNGGLRYEYTRTSITSPGGQDLVSRKYGNVFPSLAIRRTIGLEQDINLSYARRINRPGYNDIAPYVFFWGPRSFSAGNTKLFPAISNALTASYHWKQWTISLNFTHSQNEISGFQTEIDSMSNVIYRSQNLRSLNTLGLTNSYSAVLTSWWDLQGTVALQHQVASSYLPDNTKFKLPGCNVSLTSRVRFPKNFSFEVSATYQSKTISGSSEFLPLGSLNAGIRKDFGKKGTLQLSVDDILYTNYWRTATATSSNGINNYFQYDWHNQYIRLTYSMNLGNVSARPAAARHGAAEERKRVE